ncbi:MAG: hypothetical protein K2K84_09455 [Muribaculaceae bacterium]|nr:hypothetical protein [Muribaculaceae bacterium]
MIITLSDNQMLGKWRRGALLEPALADCSVERFDGLQVDPVLRQAMRTWYLGLLREGNPAMLKVTDISDRAGLRPEGTGRWRVTVPADTVRILELTIEGQPWPVRTLDVNRETDRRAIAALGNRYCRMSFTAVIGADRQWTLTGPPLESPGIASCRAITDPGDEIYVLDERLLDEIPARAREILETEI